MYNDEYYPPFFKNTFYHIYNRGTGKEKIFYTNENYCYFLLLYDKYLSEYLDTFAYSLLPNHFHLLVRCNTAVPEQIAENFRKLFISYSMAVNKQQKRVGNLFQKRFKRKSVNCEKYLVQVVYYIHSNPVHHKIVKDFKDYKYSSFEALNSEKKTKILREEVYSWFGGRENFLVSHKEQQIALADDIYKIEG